MLKITFQCAICENRFIKEVDPPVDLMATPAHCPNDPLANSPELIRVILIEEVPPPPAKGPLDAIYAGILRIGEKSRS